MALKCPQCQNRLSWRSLKKRPFPCPHCGVKLNSKLPREVMIASIVVWSFLEVPFLKLDDQYNLFGPVLRIIITLLLAVPVLAVAYSAFGVLSLASEDSGKETRE